jgi:hypothetical protein
MVFIVIVLLLPGFMRDISADPRIPEPPLQPRVDINETRHALGDHTFRVSLINARGDKRSGLLALKTDFIDIDVSDHGSVEKRKVNISSIDSIEFNKWKGAEARENEFLFYPARIKIVFADKKIIECRSDIKILSRLNLIDGKNSVFLYTYFYDYRKNNAWRNTGQADMSYPETNPHEDTVVRIVFSR